MCRYFNFRFFPSLKISSDYLLGILVPIHFPSLIKILHGTNYPRRIEGASMHRCSCFRAFKANAARASSPFVLGDPIGEQCHRPNRISGKKKKKWRKKEERLQKRGPSLILEFRPRDSNPSLPFWESNTRPILIADNDDKSFPTCNTLENLPVIHAQ